jgi:hypothetical protein
VISCPSSSTISLDFNDSTSITSRESPGEIEGASGATIGPGETSVETGTKRKSGAGNSSSASDGETGTDRINRAVNDFGRAVGQWDPFLFTPDCCKKARMDMRLAHVRARFVQDKITRLLQESRKLTRTLKELVDDSD